MALQHVGSYLGYTGRGAGAVGKAASDPLLTNPQSGKVSLYAEGADMTLGSLTPVRLAPMATTNEQPEQTTRWANGNDTRNHPSRQIFEQPRRVNAYGR